MVGLHPSENLPRDSSRPHNHYLSTGELVPCIPLIITPKHPTTMKTVKPKLHSSEYFDNPLESIPIASFNQCTNELEREAHLSNNGPRKSGAYTKHNNAQQHSFIQLVFSIHKRANV